MQRMLDNEIYDFIAERSMSRGFQNYFVGLSEDHQTMVGIELLALRTWAASHVISNKLGNTPNEDMLFARIERSLIEDCGETIFNFITLRCTSYGGLGRLPGGTKYVESQFKSNIKDINSSLQQVPDEEINYMLDLFLDIPTEILNKYLSRI